MNRKCIQAQLVINKIIIIVCHLVKARLPWK